MKRWLTLVILFAADDVFSQNRITDKNKIGWYSTIVTPRLSNKVSLHAEAQWRRDEYIKNWQQLLLRAGVNYKVHPQVVLHAGYGFIRTHAYGEYTLAANPQTFPEHRIYQQLVLTSPIGKATLQNRIRLEQRWVGRFATPASTGPNSWTFLNRFRFMPRIDVPLGNKWYAASYDEIFIGFGKNVGENVFDQNRIAVVAGYKFNSTCRAEAGFLNQTVQLGREIQNKNVYQYNSGFVINTYFNLGK